MTTLRYTHRHGPVYTGHACRHLPSAVPWISEDRLLPPPATPPVWVLCGAVLTAFWSSVCSRSGSSTASLCLYFLQLSAFLDGFFMVVILLGSGDTLIKCYEPEIKNKIKKVIKKLPSYSHSLLIMW